MGRFAGSTLRLTRPRYNRAGRVESSGKENGSEARRSLNLLEKAFRKIWLGDRRWEPGEPGQEPGTGTAWEPGQPDPSHRHLSLKISHTSVSIPVPQTVPHTGRPRQQRSVSRSSPHLALRSSRPRDRRTLSSLTAYRHTSPSPTASSPTALRDWPTALPRAPRLLRRPRTPCPQAAAGPAP